MSKPIRGSLRIFSEPFQPNVSLLKSTAQPRRVVIFHPLTTTLTR